MKSLISVVCVASALAFACQKSPEKQAEELREAERNAEQKTVEARQEADVKAAKAYEEVDRTAANQNEKVADKAQDVNDSLMTAREDLRKDIEGDLNSIDKKLVDLRTKLNNSKTVKTSRTEMDASIRLLKDQSEALRRDMSQIQTSSADAFGNLKSNLKSRVDNLEKSVDDIDNKM
ncbi:MAG TPA: hypothetical protein VFQ61_29575 [Polyangiaceae bacterium]|nr:hypothetical protein [Polyangiaceae bacterium]